MKIGHARKWAGERPQNVSHGQNDRTDTGNTGGILGTRKIICFPIIFIVN